jgi:hypothetical protein
VVAVDEKRGESEGEVQRAPGGDAPWSGVHTSRVSVCLWTMTI